MNTYPKLLFWDMAFPSGMPRQYYKSYGVKNKEAILTWLQKQIASTVITNRPATATGPVNTVLKPCNLGELQCGDGRCVGESQVCDGRRHCADGADEQNCAPPEQVDDAGARRPGINARENVTNGEENRSSFRILSSMPLGSCIHQWIEMQ